MGFFSKLWKGVKKVVKGVAHSIKRVAKAVITALPGGKKLWEFGTKVGKGIMKGIGQIAGFLGPIGTMALSFVLAPFIGPMISSLWTGFGAGAAAMAATGNGIVHALGVAGQAIFNGANFVGGTLGALGDAITKGIGQIAKGNFGEAGSIFIDNMKSTFTGEAGRASVAKGAAAVALRSGGVAGTSGINLDALSKSADLSSMDVGLRDANGKLFTPSKEDIFGTKFDPTGDLSIPTTKDVFGIPGESLGPKGNISSIESGAFDVPAVTVGDTGKLNIPGGVEQKGFLDKAKDALKAVSSFTGGGGTPPNSGDEVSGFEEGLERTVISAPGKIDPITAAGSGNFFAELIAQANRTTAGGFS